MILIADSGSSKTDWALVENKENIKFLKSKGINPFFQSSEEVFQIVKETFGFTGLCDNIDKIYFYGAGCIKGQNSYIVEKGLMQFFDKALAEVNDDMIGAARALFFKDKGIACILGTGANSCKYDGTNIIEKISALGFILGDEGSGAYFGKQLINNYFKKIMPGDLSEKFRDEYASVEGEILNHVYKQPGANSYLARFTYFLSRNIDHRYVRELLSDGFEAFISNNISKYMDYQNYTVGFVGSIAYHFSGILESVCFKNNVTLGKIVEKPIDNLIEFHIKNTEFK
jgi:N-acetylglucosamine kinase-like BadF-type ATPase